MDKKNIKINYFNVCDNCLSLWTDLQIQIKINELAFTKQYYYCFCKYKELSKIK